MLRKKSQSQKIKDYIFPLMEHFEMTKLKMEDVLAVATVGSRAGWQRGVSMVTNDPEHRSCGEGTLLHFNYHRGYKSLHL
jgi:hypothetical protein